MKYKVITKTNLSAHPHSWTKGLDYEVVERPDYIILASNEGQVNYLNEVKEYVFEQFEVIKS